MAPVVIPALAPTLDKSLKEDRSLCPVRALRYYLDKTQDLRQGKELVFVSFKKGFTKDISPATISSWIKQTVILCYDLSDQESLTLHQVKVHDVRAFAASKAFQGGISLDQILAACHWKSHANFQKKKFSQKMAAILNFRTFRKIAKHKNAYISKIVLDRAISTKFLTHRVSLQSSHTNFQKKFILPKMAAIFYFRIFAQKLQNTKMLISRKPCYIERFRRNF